MEISLQLAGIDHLADATIRIISPQLEQTIRVHRLILASKSDYFRMMFKYQTNLEMKVRNGYILLDIINRFYGNETNMGNYPPWQHLLETLICEDYLQIPHRHNLVLLNGENPIPSCGLDLLIETTRIMNYNVCLLYSIKRMKLDVPKDISYYFDKCCSVYFMIIVRKEYSNDENREKLCFNIYYLDNGNIYFIKTIVESSKDIDNINLNFKAEISNIFFPNNKTYYTIHKSTHTNTPLWG